MNYYERYCGDYSRDTSHLSLAEHGAFTIMLDVYYSTEKPLPASVDALYRICRAMTQAERDAVRSVADEFFPVGADGLRRNARAERDIVKASARIKAARENGMKRNTDRVDAARMGVGKPIEQEPSGIPSGLPSGSADGNPSGTYGESTRPHTPISKSQKLKPREQEPLAVPDWMPPEWKDFDEMRRAKNGKAWTRRAQEMAIRELGKLRDAGHDPTAVLSQSVIAGYPGLYPVRIASVAGRPTSREPTLAEKRARNIDILTGKVRDERVVEGTAERVGGAVVLSIQSDLRESGGDDVGGCGPERNAAGMGRGAW